MPVTLYKYILIEMLKLLLTSLAVLVTVIAVAMAVKPLSDGLLGPMALIKFVFYSAPTILDIALPFAGAFASAMVFTRMVTDNEILACRANGMSYGAILTPVVILGTILTLGMFFLSSWIIPYFYRKAANTLQQDLVRVVVSQLEEGKPFRQGNTVVYADAVQEQILTEEQQRQVDAVDGVAPSRLIMLRGVAVGKMDDMSRLRNDATAEQADLLLYQGESQSWVEIRLGNAMYYSGDPQQPWGAVRSISRTFDLPNPFENELSFLSWRELRKLKEEPAKLPDVGHARDQLIGMMASKEVVSAVARRLTSPSGARTLSLLGYIDQQRYLIRSPVVEESSDTVHMKAQGDQKVIVEKYESGLPVYRVSADAGQLSVNYESKSIRLKLDLQQVTVSDLRRERPPAHRARMDPITSLRWNGEIVDPLLARSTFDLVQLAYVEPYKSSGPVEMWVEEVIKQIDRVKTGRRAMQNARAASAVACTFVLLLGAVLSIQMRGRTPLEVFFWSFGLAAMGVIITRSAENGLPHPLRGETAGIAIIWSGCILLAAVVGLISLRMARH